MAGQSPLFDSLFSLQGRTALVTGASGGIGFLAGGSWLREDE